MIAPDAPPPLDAALLPDGVRSRFVDGVNGLRMHVLEAGDDAASRPCLLLLHGFPELAYSWRNVMRPLADAGYYVVAPDQRGYGRTTGWDARYDGDLLSFRMFNLARDAFGLLHALGRRSVAAVIGHDFGSPVAAWCALLRPDVFRSVALMSAPFGGPPQLPASNTASTPTPTIARITPPATPTAPATAPRTAPAGIADMDAALAALPRPRKHYQRYYGTRAAEADMLHCRQGLHDFLRAYYHMKSADWPANRPEPLAAWTADELARLPTYYVMDLDQDMAATVAPHMPSPEAIAGCRWLPDRELAVYSGEFGRTGLQGGLQWYRCSFEAAAAAEHSLFAGRAIEVPACFIAGASDWGVFQKPGEFERMQRSGCSRFTGSHLIPGAGHWVQQEQPWAVVEHLLTFLHR